MSEDGLARLSSPIVALLFDDADEERDIVSQNARRGLLRINLFRNRLNDEFEHLEYEVRALPATARRVRSVKGNGRISVARRLDLRRLRYNLNDPL